MIDTVKIVLRNLIKMSDYDPHSFASFVLFSMMIDFLVVFPAASITGAWGAVVMSETLICKDCITRAISPGKLPPS